MICLLDLVRFPDPNLDRPLSCCWGLVPSSGFSRLRCSQWNWNTTSESLAIRLSSCLRRYSDGFCTRSLIHGLQEHYRVAQSAHCECWATGRGRLCFVVACVAARFRFVIESNSSSDGSGPGKSAAPLMEAGPGTQRHHSWLQSGLDAFHVLLDWSVMAVLEPAHRLPWFFDDSLEGPRRVCCVMNS